MSAFSLIIEEETLTMNRFYKTAQLPSLAIVVVVVCPYALPKARVYHWVAQGCFSDSSGPCVLSFWESVYCCSLNIGILHVWA